MTTTPEPPITDEELEEFKRQANRIFKLGPQYWDGMSMVVRIIDTLKSEREKSKLLEETMRTARFALVEKLAIAQDALERIYENRYAQGRSQTPGNWLVQAELEAQQALHKIRGDASKMNESKEVSEEELKNFISKYPRKLEVDVTYICEPPLKSWNDFSLGNWPDSMVASQKMAVTGYSDPELNTKDKFFIHYDRIDPVAQTEIEKLRAQLQSATEVLKFYAAPSVFKSINMSCCDNGIQAREWLERNPKDG